MKILLTIILVLNFQTIISAQYSNLKKSEIEKLFRKSIEQKSRKRICLISNPWVINNSDSLYFKGDTIKLINQNNGKYIGFCEMVNWTFYRKNKFCLIESQTCREPSSAKVGTMDNFYELEIKEEGMNLTIEINNRKNQFSKFIVLSIFKSEDQIEITLKRI